VVKHVVKPFLLRILRESRVPKKSVFTRLFGVFFCFGIPWGGVLLPNVARYQLRHTPKCEKYSIFRSFSVSGQTCGQTVFIEDFAREQSAEKVNVYKASRRFLLRETLGAVSCSQSKRATNCATPRRNYIIISSVRFFVKLKFTA